MARPVGRLTLCVGDWEGLFLEPGVGGVRMNALSFIPVSSISMKQGLLEDDRGVRSESELESLWDKSDALL